MLFVLGVIVGGSALWGGLEYYLVPLSERPFSPLHDLYAPTGLIGHGLGIIGTLMIAFGVTIYMLRKRVPFLSRVGKLRDWLHFHIFLCLLGPFLVLLHTSFKFGGLVAISFWSMSLVVASGVFGRWVYVWIPKTMNGRFLGVEELRKEMSELLDEAEDRIDLSSEQLIDILRPVSREASSTEADSSGRTVGDRRRRPRKELGIFAAVAESVRYRVRRRSERARLHRALTESGVAEPTRSRVVRQLEAESRLEQQLRMLHPFRRAFRYWHAFHLPLAVVMLLILVVHVGVAVAFGYTWIWGGDV